VDVEGIAFQLGVDEVVIAPIIGDGRLEQRGSKTRIFAQVRAHPTRRRFTIAHEIGHLWLQQNRSGVPDVSPGGHAEERFCNAFAAALLMPPNWIGAQGRKRPHSLAELNSIADEAEVSLAACLLQLRRFAAWRQSLLHWSWDSGNWRLWSTTGVPRNCDRQISSLKETRRAINSAGHARGQPLTTALWLCIGGENRRVEAEVRVEGDRALALAKLDQHQIAPP